MENFGKVIGITDGDTFTLLVSDNEQQKIRLHGIDCPEKKQPFGTVARQRLSELIFQKQVKIKRTDVDMYGRTIALVWTLDGILINEELLFEGLAWHYDQYDKNTNWEILEENARKVKLGIWSQPDAVPPWEWRKNSKN